jgi:hypothetical protein
MSPLDDLERLLDAGRVATLAYLDDGGAPATSLVPFVATRGPRRLHLLVSDLAAHTRALAADPRASLLVHDPPSADRPGGDHAVPRVAIRARAAFLARDEAEARGATAAYRAKYEAADMLLGLGDFRFVELVPERASLVLGFGRAFEVRGPELDALEAVAPRRR